MRNICVTEFVSKYGIREASELLRLNNGTVWRWIKDRKDVTIELEKGKPVAYTIRKEVRRED